MRAHAAFASNDIDPMSSTCTAMPDRTCRSGPGTPEARYVTSHCDDLTVGPRWSPLGRVPRPLGSTDHWQLEISGSNPSRDVLANGRDVPLQERQWHPDLTEEYWYSHPAWSDSVGISGPHRLLLIVNLKNCQEMLGWTTGRGAATTTGLSWAHDPPNRGTGEERVVTIHQTRASEWSSISARSSS